MAFDIGETVICSVEVKDSDGAYHDPSTSMTITITRRVSGTVVVDNQDMTPGDKGKYHYDYQTASASKGAYDVVYKATDNSRITIEKESFELE